MLGNNDISISKGRNKKTRTIYSRSDFFKGELIVDINEERITLSKPSIFSIEKVRKVTINKSGGFYFAVTHDLPFGGFNFDKEESNEDLKVIYFDSK